MTDMVCVNDFEKRAYEILPRNALDYYRSGAGPQLTLELNKTAFNRLRLRPRVLRNVSNRDSSTTVFGEKVSIPLGISPTAMQRMAHPDGECGSARAAEAAGVIFILSTLSTTSLEQVATAAPKCIKWFQLYIYQDRSLTESLVRRAERAGYKALVLTVDTPFFGVRLADVRNKFTLPAHLTLANFTGIEATKIHEATHGSGLNEYVSNLFDSSVSWDDIAWLRKITRLPIVLKGILTAEDAIIAAEIGVEGIVVSNHGARQIDGTPATIEALPEVVKAVNGKVEIFMDGGVRQGTDIFKALALGAKMCFIGRPNVWGLTCSGEVGSTAVLNILKQEFDQSLALTGCTAIRDIKRDMVKHESVYSRI